jgi:DNA primase
VIFPIRDRRGRVLGFGGRVLDDSLPKYLNSPETAVFHKGREVYGLYELLARNAKPERILVVEGYMDVIALSQFGLGYAVATLGTATSKEHLELLFRFSSEVVLCFDGDKAGRAASWRAVEAALPSLKDGRQVKIMQLPAGDDPDILVRQEGLVAFEQRITSAASLSAFFFDRLKQGLNLNDLEGRASLASKAKGYLEKIPSGVFQDLMLEKLKEISKVDQLDFFGNPTTLKLGKLILGLSTIISTIVFNKLIPGKFKLCQFIFFSSSTSIKLGFCSSKDIAILTGDSFTSACFCLCLETLSVVV